MRTIEPLHEMLRILRGARGLIENPEGWTKHAYARKETGKWARVWDKKAACFCTVGAILRSGGFHPFFEDAYLALWNDAPGRTHAEVLSAFDEAIASTDREIAERGGA